MSDHFKGGVIWVTGFSASGKTTVARILHRQIKSKKISSIFLDGDDLRSILGGQWGYERRQRVELAKVYFRLASHLAAQEHIVVISAVAMYEEIRQWVRQNISNTVEVFLSVPYSIRYARDENTKGIYPSLNEHSMGSLYDPPDSPDLQLDNFGENTPEKSALDIMEFYFSQKGDQSADKGRSTHWNNYYAKQTAPLEPSGFAHFVLANIPKRLRLLEVGCGNGRDAIFFNKSGHDVTALDASEQAIYLCKKVHGSNGVNFFHCKISTSVNLIQNSFDVIYSRFTLNAMTTDEECSFIETSYKLLKFTGKIFIECRSINDPLARQGEIISLNERCKGHYRRFVVKEDLSEKLESVGFEVISLIESNGLARFGDEDPVVIRVEATKISRV